MLAAAWGGWLPFACSPGCSLRCPFVATQEAVQEPLLLGSCAFSRCTLLPCPIPHPSSPPAPLPQTFLLWLCTFHTNLVTCWLFLSLAILFWLLAGGVGTSSERVTLTKVAGGWGFMVAAVAFYDGTAALMKDVYGKQILPVFPLKPVNKVSLGDFGTKRFVEQA